VKAGPRRDAKKRAKSVRSGLGLKLAPAALGPRPAALRLVRLALPPIVTSPLCQLTPKLTITDLTTWKLVPYRDSARCHAFLRASLPCASPPSRGPLASAVAGHLVVLVGWALWAVWALLLVATLYGALIAVYESRGKARILAKVCICVTRRCFPPPSRQSRGTGRLIEGPAL